MRLSSFFRHCETDFFRFFYCSSHQFLIFRNRIDVQKIPKRPPFYIFWHYATCDLPETSKKFRKKIRIFFSQFLVFWELLLSPVVEKVVFVFVSFWAFDMAPTWAVPGLFWLVLFFFVVFTVRGSHFFQLLNSSTYLSNQTCFHTSICVSWFHKLLSIVSGRNSNQRHKLQCDQFCWHYIVDFRTFPFVIFESAPSQLFHLAFHNVEKIRPIVKLFRNEM